MKSLKLEIASRIMVILFVILIFPISYVYGEQKAEDYYLEGKDYYINGNYDQAIESFTKAIKLNNKPWPCLCGKTQSRFKSSNIRFRSRHQNQPFGR